MVVSKEVRCCDRTALNLQQLVGWLPKPVNPNTQVAVRGYVLGRGGAENVECPMVATRTPGVELQYGNQGLGRQYSRGTQDLGVRLLAGLPETLSRQ